MPSKKNRRRRPGESGADSGASGTVGGVDGTSANVNRTTNGHVNGTAGRGSGTASGAASGLQSGTMNGHEDDGKLATAAAAPASAESPPMGSPQQKAPATTTKEAVNDVSDRFARMGVNVGLPVMPEKQQPGTAGTPLTVKTNVFPMKLPPIAVYRYDVEIVGTNKAGREVEFTKRNRDDYTQFERRKLCYAIWKVQIAPRPLFNGAKVYYDGQKQLYSLKPLKIPEEGNTFPVEPRPKDGINFDEGIVSVQFKIQMVTEDFQLSLADLSSMSRNLGDRDQSLMQFINIATSQAAVANTNEHVTFPKGQSYLMDPDSEGFAAFPHLSDGKYLAVGAHKSAMAIEGPEGRNHRKAAVAVDTAKTAFHKAESVRQKMIDLGYQDFSRAPHPSILSRLNQQLGDLMAEVWIGDKIIRRVKIHSVSSSNARERYFDLDGRRVSVEEHFRNKYKCSLEFPNAPLLVCRRGDRETLFPMELCYLGDNQRVQQPKQTPAQLKEMRTACIVPPATRMHQNELNAEALHLNDPRNTWLAGAGISVDAKPLQVKARVLSAPTVMYSGAPAKMDNDNKWRIEGNRFAEPKRLDNWGIFLLTAGQRDRMSLEDLSAFVGVLVEAGRRHGMEIARPALMSQTNADRRSVESKFVEARNKKCNFMFFVQSDSSELHEFIKYLERKYLILTQDMKISVASEAVNKRRFQTMENVVCKTNVKLGGLNHVVAIPSGRWMSPMRLFMGMAMSHPKPGARTGTIPSVIGYAANTRQEWGFVGDFGFQQVGRTDNLDVLDIFIKNVVDDFKRSRGGRVPQDAVIYRSGVSEGEYKMVLQYEVPMIRKAFANNGCASNMKLMLILVSKMHNVRIFPSNVNPSDRAMEQNLKPGTVVDVGIVHPEFPEFYLSSHKALQGSAKVPRYTILVNDHGYNMDQLEEMTFGLCFAHEIVTMSTSTPTPLYVATRFAERGHVLVVQKSLNEEGSADAVNVQDANKTLPYHGTLLGGVRFNA